ncbi:MAG: response regulator [Marinilabiliaceae bacterium]|nr:response regulator [Marinilabiliaceae bacterium]
MGKCFFSFLLMLVFIKPLLGQINLDFDQLSIDDGLTSSRANAIIQDSYGFIWIGTWNGLIKYDGNGVEIFQPKYRDTTALTNREITALVEDSDGLIWIGTTNGLNNLDPRTGKFEHFDIKGSILSLFTDSAGDVWIGTAGYGLKHLNRKTRNITSYLGSEHIHKIYEDSRKEFWLASYSGLFNFNRETKRYQRYMNGFVRADGSKYKHMSVYDIIESHDNSLWLASNYYGLIKVIVTENKDDITTVDFTPIVDNKIRFNLDFDHLNFDQFGNLWIGTNGNGLYMLAKSEQDKAPSEASFQIFQNDINNSYSLKGNDFISSLFIDNLGTIWVGSSVINIANITSHGITRYNTQTFKDGKIRNNWVFSITCDENGNLFVGGSDDILIYNLNDYRKSYVGSISNDNFNRINNRTVTSIKSLIVQPNGQLIAATNNSGAYVLESVFDHIGKPSVSLNMKVERFKGSGSNYINHVIKSKTNPNVFWIGTLHDGLFCYDQSKIEGNVTQYKAGSNNRHLSDNSIRVLEEDDNGVLWVGTNNGLNSLNIKTGIIEKYYFEIDSINSINDNIINDILTDSEGDVWIGTNSGLNKIVASERSQLGRSAIFLFPDQKKLSGEIILNILEDEHRNLWIGVYNGLLKFNIEKENIIDEFYLKEYTRVKIRRLTKWKDKSGRFYFGGGNGFLTFHPDSIGWFNKEPKIQLTGFLLNNKIIEIGDTIDNRVILNKSIVYSDTLVLSYYDKVFSLSFALLDFNAPKNNQFAYKLDGFDDDWNYVANRNLATYTDLKSGTYQFNVKGCNSSGVWSLTTRSLTIIITPPWWQTDLAYVSYFVFILLLLSFLYYRVKIRLKMRQDRALRKIKIEKDHELSNLKLQFFTNITHELRTPLSLILAPLEEMINDKRMQEYYRRNMELIKKNANRLLRLINQLMEFRKIENAKMDMHLQKANIIDLVNDIYDSFRSMAELKQMKFKINALQNPIFVDIDKEKLDRIMFNLLSNAFKFTEDGGEIIINIGVVDPLSTYYIEISDSGIGIPMSKTERIFERFYQIDDNNTGGTGGIGLYLTKAYVELHGGKIEVVKSKVEGSCFRIEMPIHISLESDNVTYNNCQIADDPIDELLQSETEEVLTQTSNPYILIAEDDIEMNEFLLNSLSDKYQVRTAFNGKDAFEMAVDSIPDLIILDIMMPGMDGLDACKMLKSDINTSHIPVLFLTAKTNIESELDGLKFGAIDYITKPFSMMALKLKIQNIFVYQQSLQAKFRKVGILEPESITLTSLDETFLADAVAAVDRNLDNPEFDVDNLSKEIGLSSNKTYRKIKALTGQTAKEFIRNQRLKVAVDLIVQNRRSISEIVYLVGFSTPSYFTKCFRELYGCTPKEYLSKHIESQSE